MPHVTPLLKPYFGLYLTQVAVPKVSTRCCIAGPSLPFQPPSSPPSQGTLLLLPAIPNMHLPHGGGGAAPSEFPKSACTAIHAADSYMLGACCVSGTILTEK